MAFNVFFFCLFFKPPFYFTGVAWLTPSWRWVWLSVLTELILPFFTLGQSGTSASVWWSTSTKTVRVDPSVLWTSHTNTRALTRLTNYFKTAQRSCSAFLSQVWLCCWKAVVSVALHPLPAPLLSLRPPRERTSRAVPRLIRPSSSTLTTVVRNHDGSAVRDRKRGRESGWGKWQLCKCKKKLAVLQVSHQRVIKI